MMPDGTLVPWRSPAGTPLSIAAAAPVIPWTDLLYAIAPNGRTLTYTVTPREDDVSPVGVFKTTFANAIAAASQFATGPGQPVGEPFVPGRPMGFLAPPGTDPQADVLAWVARADAGEPYDDAQAKAIVSTLESFHAPYWIDSSTAPAPLFVASGFTDDLFPVDEALRFVNRTRRDHPETPVSMMFGDFGHQRASNKSADRARLIASIHAWMDHYLRGAGTPPSGVSAATETCPRDAPAEGPFTAPTFAALARGEVRFSSAEPLTIDSSGGDPRIGAAVDPVTGGGDACAATSAADQAGTATYRLPAATGAGYTLLGAPTIVARLRVSGSPGVAQVAGRLWDVAPGGSSQTLVARGSFRPSGDGAAVWQLHPGAWRFAAGHVPKLELLGADPPFARPSNGSFSVEVGRIELRLPVREVPDCRVVMPAAAPVVPAGQALAPGVSAATAPGCGRRAGGGSGPRLRLALRCTGAGLRATATVRGGRARRVDFYVRGRRVARDRRAPFSRIVERPVRSPAAVRVVARAAIAGARSIRAGRSGRGCRVRRGASFTG
jgi:hypothetical protein